MNDQLTNLKSIDPTQYDSPELDWKNMGDENHDSRKFFRAGLDTVIQSDDLRNKRIVDIGCGTGQLFNWLKDKGVLEITGFDPSENNIKTVKELYPSVDVSKATLDEFVSKNTKKYDAAFSIMVFEHVQDLESAFKEVSSLLDENGVFYLIIGDKDYFLINDKKIRGKNFIDVEVTHEFSDGSIETKTTRLDSKHGKIILYDITRPVELIHQNAISAGFEIIQEKSFLGPMFVPESERYLPLSRLFVLKKI